MKKYILLIAVLVMAIPFCVNAEEKTLISGEIESGGYGGPVVKLSSVNNEFCVFIGGRGGWIINHAFVVGGGGYGLATDIFVSGKKLVMGYGGLELGYVFLSDSLVHFTLHSLLGFGGVSLETDPMSADEFFVIEPEATVVLNVSRFFRIAAGASYRFVTGVTTSGLSDAALSGLTGQLVFKFGSF
jgi:hypothetical protein